MSTTTTRTVQEVFDYESGLLDEKKLFFRPEIGTDYTFKRKIVWTNVIIFIILHCGALYGLYLTLTEVKWFTWFLVWLKINISGSGITVGAHRLYSHKSYKAKLPFRIILLILHTMAGQNSMYIWVRDHRQHHKYSDTDADPHNANRGFFFCHMGWLMSKKHPLVIEKGKTIDMSDLKADPLVMFQKKYYFPLYLVFSIVIPIYFTILLTGESIWTSLFVIHFFPYVVVLHFTWTVNSLAHFYGTKPYDKNMVPVENRLVSILTGGEGWHNYHHAFPWDYKASEFGELGFPINFTRLVIETMAYFGQAYDLKQASIDMVQKRIERTGDSSYHTRSRSTVCHPNHSREAQEKRAA